MKSVLIIPSILLIFIPASFAAPNSVRTSSEKKSWDWTTAERASALRDPAKRLERVRANERRQGRSRITANRVRSVGDVIDGREHPELYFPTQLFEHLARVAFAGRIPSDSYRYAILQRSDLFANPADWNRFADIVANYGEVLKREAAAADAGDTQAVSAIQKEKCVAEGAALRQARQAFGKVAFDRMLYEAIAPTMSTAFSIDTDFEKSISKRVEIEERCQ